MSTNQFAPGCCCGLPFSGTVIGCNLSTGLSGVTVEIQDHSTHATLGTTVSTSGGAFTGTANMTNGQSIDLVYSGYSGRLSGVIATSTSTSTGKAWGNRTLLAGTGWVCVLPCILPVATTLTVASTGGSAFCNSFPNDTIVYQAVTVTGTGTLFGWLGSVPFNHPVTGHTNMVYFFSAGSGGNWGLNSWKAGIPLDSIVSPVSTNQCPPGGNIISVSCSGHIWGGTIHE